MSVFVAVDPDPAVRAELGAAIERLSARVPANWLPPHKLHLTLLFLGEPPREARQALAAKLEPLAAGAAPFSLAARGAGVFETQRAPAVLWLGVGGALDRLGALRAGVVEALGELAPRAEVERPYVPHLTLARGKTRGQFDALLPELEARAWAAFEVRALTVYESRDGRFTPLVVLPFSARG